MNTFEVTNTYFIDNTNDHVKSQLVSCESCGTIMYFLMRRHAWTIHMNYVVSYLTVCPRSICMLDAFLVPVTTIDMISM